jgi:hypothetical protein
VSLLACLLAWVPAGLLGCGGPGEDGEDTCPPRPILEYCQRGPCPDHDTFVANLRIQAQQLLAGNGLGGMSCHHGYLGTCGGLRVASLFNGLYGPTAYFGADGALRGVSYLTDSGPCSTLTYGEVPACEPVTEEDLCAR